MKQKTWNYGYLLISLLLSLSLISTLSIVVIGYYRIDAEAYRNYDRIRQRNIEIEVISELLKECLFRSYNFSNSWQDLENSLQELVSSYLSQEDWEVRFFSSDPEPAEISVLPMGLRSRVRQIRWEVMTDSEKKNLNSIVGRWAGMTEIVFAGRNFSVTVSQPGGESYEYTVCPIAVPLSSFPYLVYDRVAEGDVQVSGPVEVSGFRMPEMWKALAGHAWSHHVPYRLRELLGIRLELFRRLLDPVNEEQFLSAVMTDADWLNFSQLTSREDFIKKEGVEWSADHYVEIDLSRYSGERLVLSGEGNIRLRGMRDTGVLLLVALPGEYGEGLNIELEDPVMNRVGPLVFYGMCSWRSAAAAQLRIHGMEGTRLVGAAFLWPGTNLQATVQGHLTCHWPRSAGEGGVTFPLVASNLEPELAYWTPIFNLWDIRSEY